jgi:hypothetical protein
MKKGKDDEGPMMKGRGRTREIDVSWAIVKFLILHFILFVTNYIFRY